LVNSGIGPFYDGLLHLFVSPRDLLFCLGIGLLAGLSGKARARLIILSSAAAWITGALFALQGVTVVWVLASPLLLLGVGVLVATGARLPKVMTVSLTTLATVVHGLLNGAALAPLGVIGVLGLYSGFLVVVLVIASGVTGFKALWTRTAVRIAGSWIGAVGLLFLGWSLRPVL
jgi:hydrogenase/urease accessory protein HupE